MTSGERQRAWRAHDSMASSLVPVGIASTTPMSPEVVHPSAEQLEAAAYGWLGKAEAKTILTHARACSVCEPRLASDEEVRRRLGTLRRASPRFNTVDAVLGRLDHDSQSPRLFRLRATRLALLAVLLSVGLVSGWVMAGRRNKRRARRLTLW
jgi:anti-sigma factor ChrR (cupin superfamily)